MWLQCQCCGKWTYYPQPYTVMRCKYCYSDLTASAFVKFTK